MTLTVRVLSLVLTPSPALCYQEVLFDHLGRPVSMGRVSLVCGILLLVSSPLLTAGTTPFQCWELCITSRFSFIRQT